jgi:hypothetical protein
MSPRPWFALAAVLWARPGGLAGQQELIAAARAGTLRYRDQAAAIADGYRPVGPDFPGMGEHWVNPRLLLEGGLAAAHPQVLEYAEIAGRPTLVGVAYAALVEDAVPPTGLAVPASAWHTHAGRVDEESFILSHAGVHAAHHDAGPGLAIVHVWIWLENPAGVFATDNWALPCARLGYVAPPGLGTDPGRALALGAGAGLYFKEMVRVVGRPDSAEQARLDTVWDEGAAEVAARVGRGTGRTPLPRSEIPWLAAAWHRVWARVLAGASAPVRRRLAALDPS